MKIKTGDKIVFISGKERHQKDQTGIVEKTLKKTNSIIVKDRNVKVKQIKKTANQAGQKISFEAPIAANKVMVICPACNKRTRVGYSLVNGKKERICKKCSASLDSGAAKVKVKSKA